MDNLEDTQTWDAERIRLELAHACALKALLTHMGWPASLTVPFDGVQIEIRKLEQQRCICGLAIIPAGELRIEIGSTIHRLAGPCFQTPSEEPSP